MFYVILIIAIGLFILLRARNASAPARPPIIDRPLANPGIPEADIDRDIVRATVHRAPKRVAPAYPVDDPFSPSDPLERDLPTVSLVETMRQPARLPADLNRMLYAPGLCSPHPELTTTTRKQHRARR